MTTALVAERIESAVLGCILEAPWLLKKAADLEPSDLFCLSSNLSIFRHIQDLQKRGAGIDIPTLVQSLELSGELGKVGDVGYISKLVDGCVVENFPSYVKNLREMAFRRRLAHALERASGLARETSVSTERLCAEVQEISAAYANGIAAERELRFRTAVELATETHPDVKWIAGPFLAAGGITLAVGKVKAAGKTTLFTHLVKSVLVGAPFMGRATTKGPVVYLTEQSPVSFRVALQRAGLLDQDGLRILTWAEVSRLPWPELVRVSERECQRIGAVLLVVDTVGQFTGLVGDAENNAGDALRAMQPLQQAAAAGLGVLISQHERKSGGDIEDSGRGSSAFAGAADIVLNIRRRPGNGSPNLRVFRALSRFDETPTEITVELTAEGYRSLDSETIALDDAEEAVMRIVPRSESRAYTVDELLEAAHVKRTTGQDALTRLVEQGRILRVGAGRKGAPFRYFAAENHSAGNATHNRQTETVEPEDEFWKQQASLITNVCRSGAVA